MSRSNYNTSKARTGSQVSRPSQLPSNINRGTSNVGRGPSNIGQGGSNINRSQVTQRMNSSDFKNLARKDLGQSSKLSNISQDQRNKLQQNFQSNFGNQRDTNRQLADNVRDNIKENRPYFDNMFKDNFYDRFDVRPDWYHPGFNAWAAASWVGVNDWLGWGWSTPYYYEDSGYPVEVPQEYYTQPSTEPQYTTGSQTSSQAPVGPAAQGDWMSLGVYAAAQKVEDAPYTNMFVQLMIDKTGNLSGSYYNSTTEQIHQIDGFVDKDSQEAVWRLSDNADSPVMTAGIFNLTQDIATVNVRYSSGVETNLELVRLAE